MSLMHTGVVLGEFDLSASGSSSSTMRLGELEGDELLDNFDEVLISLLGDMETQPAVLSSLSTDLLGDLDSVSLVLMTVIDSLGNPSSTYSMMSDIGDGVALPAYLLLCPKEAKQKADKNGD